MYNLLSGMRVVEAASFVAAPSCALHLAQMGAEVIRIDQAGGGPDFRRWPLVAEGGQSLFWEGVNKSKKSVALDLSRPEGRELAAQIITAPGENGGLFVTNYPVNGFLAYNRLIARRPDLICVRVMGWADGRPAVDYTVNAAVGVPLITGPVGHDGPVNHVLPAWDLLTGAYAAFCLLAAERSRRETGQGQEVRLPLSDIAISSLGCLGLLAEVQLGKQDRPRVGNDLFGAFGRDFLTADGERLMVIAITARQWSGLLKVLGLRQAVAALETELGVSFAQDEGVRFQHRDRLNPFFEAAFGRATAANLAPAFETEGVCWSRYQSLSEAIATNPDFSEANPMLSSIGHPGGRYLTPGTGATLPAAARQPSTPCMALGQHTEEVLAEILGLSSGEIGRLHDTGLAASAARAGLSS